MFPTIHRFMEGLLSPRTSLRTLSEARFAQDGTGALLLERTTLFAEAQCTLGDRRLRLFCPLSPLAHRLAETTAQRLKYHPAEFLLPWRMLREEFTYTDATGTQRTCDLSARSKTGRSAPATWSRRNFPPRASRSQRQSATQTATVCSRRSILCNGSWRRPA